MVPKQGVRWCGYLFRLIKLKTKDSKDSSKQLELLKMKISLFSKSYIIKACSFFIITMLISSAPLIVDANNITDWILGKDVAADETTSLESSGVVYNSQTIPFLESSINPDLKNTNELENIVIVQDGSFIYSEGPFIPDVKFEKSPLSDQISVYTVEKGDTLSEIAESFGVSTNTIRWENNISGEKISIGQKLNILPVTGVKHIVKSGDNISNIADKYEAEMEYILIFNGISKEDILKLGDIIFVPNGIIKAVVSQSSSSSSNKTTAVSNTKVQSGYYIRPVPGRVTSPYGSRRLNGKGEFHSGVDLAGVKGVTQVAAAASGIVVQVISGCK
ncbi:MAG: LysM peptidoglycan-binding domain-containing protein, partial [Bacteroidales bacterium]|nr:LysM peptidoglycan-binding domain-containing protein [Bacteroidales bacterium]